MFTHASGAMHDWLERNERDNSDCGLGSPVAHLAREQAARRKPARHPRQLPRARRRQAAGENDIHVVHCPRSHDYFRHPAFLAKRLANAGVNLCLGTDSLATDRKIGKQKPELDMFAEMRRLAKKDKAISAGRNCAHGHRQRRASALGLAGQIGELSENAFADIIAVPFAAKKTDAHEAVLAHTGPCSPA